MSSVALKLASLAIRTLAKPIANQIKAQAREHEKFRRVCVRFAQSLHRVDMRLRLGLLRDTAAIQRQAEKEAAQAEAKRKAQQSIPTVKTEAQMKADEAAVKNGSEAAEKAKSPPKQRIRPLSEAKAIETGANFISESFLFLVAGGLIVAESWRSSRKEKNRREDVADRLAELEQSEKSARKALVTLEKEILKMEAGTGKHLFTSHKRLLPKEVWEVEEEEEKQDEPERGWFWWLPSFGTNEDSPKETTESKKDPPPPETARGKKSPSSSLAVLEKTEANKSSDVSK